MKYFIAIFIFLYTGSCSHKHLTVTNNLIKIDSSVRVNIDSSVSINIEDKFHSDSNYLNELKKVNDAICDLLYLDIGKDKYPFVVSKYVNTEPVNIDSAFMISVKSIAKFPTGVNTEYALLDFNTYKKGGKILRYKISEISFGNGKKIDNVMYYFMKDEVSDCLYELKMSCDSTHLNLCKESLEKIAMTVNFDSKKGDVK
jgi:hypothetical protein